MEAEESLPRVLGLLRESYEELDPWADGPWGWVRTVEDEHARSRLAGDLFQVWAAIQGIPVENLGIEAGRALLSIHGREVEVYLECFWQGCILWRPHRKLAATHVRFLIGLSPSGAKMMLLRQGGPEERVIFVGQDDPLFLDPDAAWEEIRQYARAAAEGGRRSAAKE